jgi:hypothetical protein
MRIAGEEVGRRGIAVLAVTALVGLLLAVHGYGRGFVAAGRGPLGVGGPVPPRATPPAGGSSSGGTATSSTAPGTRNGSTGTTTSGPSATGQRLGPLLSSTPYASFAYEVYPGPMSTAARQALAGFDVSVRASGSQEVVRVAPAGYPQGAQSSAYPRGDRVYFVEASFGDDSGNVDYNGGDDGLVVTTPQGRIVE